MYLGGHYRDRGFPHSLLFGGGGFVVVALIAFVCISAATATGSFGLLEAETLPLLAVGAAVGYVVHLALDAATKSGIWLVMPGGCRVGLPKEWAVRTGGLVKLAVAAAMVILVLGLGLAVFGDALGGATFLLGQ